MTGRCGMVHPEHAHLACTMRAGHSGGHRDGSVEWYRRRAEPSPWRKIGAREIKVGDTVNVTGITNRRSVVMRVNYVDTAPGEIILYGLQPWGYKGSREVTRIVRPETVAELYVDPRADQ